MNNLMTQNTIDSDVPQFIQKALHPYHIIPASPWPIVTASAVLGILSSAVLWFHFVDLSGIFFLLNLISVVIVSSLWFKDVITEGTHLGIHTRIVQECLSLGVILFIVTEIILFISVFWAYFHSSLAPTVEIGQWPPAGVVPLSPLSVPLLNTILLLSSGAAITWAHINTFRGNRELAINGIVLTVVLASIFTFLQWLEYDEAGFSIADGAYGSCFYFATGLHGAHVIVGTLFIIVAFVRIILYHFTKERHLGFEAAILYWHFVDIVWIVLFLAIYWWGSE